MPNIFRITPFMHVPDIGEALAFFEKLGFKCYFRLGTYAYVQREVAAFRLFQNQGDDGAPPGNRRFAYYCDVEDLAALIEEFRPVLDTFPPGDVHGPVDQHYGQRELMVLAPDGNLLVFGQEIQA